MDVLQKAKALLNKGGGGVSTSSRSKGPNSPSSLRPATASISMSSGKSWLKDTSTKASSGSQPWLKPRIEKHNLEDDYVIRRPSSATVGAAKHLQTTSPPSSSFPTKTGIGQKQSSAVAWLKDAPTIPLSSSATSVRPAASSISQSTSLYGERRSPTTDKEERSFSEREGQTEDEEGSIEIEESEGSFSIVPKQELSLRDRPTPRGMEDREQGDKLRDNSPKKSVIQRAGAQTGVGGGGGGMQRFLKGASTGDSGVGMQRFLKSKPASAGSAGAEGDFVIRRSQVSLSSSASANTGRYGRASVSGLSSTTQKYLKEASTSNRSKQPPMKKMEKDGETRMEGDSDRSSERSSERQTDWEWNRQRGERVKERDIERERDTASSATLSVTTSTNSDAFERDRATTAHTQGGTNTIFQLRTLSDDEGTGDDSERQSVTGSSPIRDPSESVKPQRQATARAKGSSGRYSSVDDVGESSLDSFVSVINSEPDEEPDRTSTKEREKEAAATSSLRRPPAPPSDLMKTVSTDLGAVEDYDALSVSSGVSLEESSEREVEKDVVPTTAVSERGGNRIEPATTSPFSALKLRSVDSDEASEADGDGSALSNIRFVDSESDDESRKEVQEGRKEETDEISTGGSSAEKRDEPSASDSLANIKFVDESSDEEAVAEGSIEESVDISESVEEERNIVAVPVDDESAAGEQEGKRQESGEAGATSAVGSAEGKREDSLSRREKDRTATEEVTESSRHFAAGKSLRPLPLVAAVGQDEPKRDSIADKTALVGVDETRSTKLKSRRERRRAREGRSSASSSIDRREQSRSSISSSTATSISSMPSVATTSSRYSRTGRREEDKKRRPTGAAAFASGAVALTEEELEMIVQKRMREREARKQEEERKKRNEKEYRKEKRLRRLQQMMRRTIECMGSEKAEIALEHSSLRQFPKFLTGLRELGRLSLRGNKISQLPSSLGSIRSLKSLDLSDNLLSLFPSALLSRRSTSSKDESLSLSLPFLPSSLQKSEPLLFCLETVDLSENPLEFLPLSLFYAIPQSLRSLQLCGIPFLSVSSFPPALRWRGVDVVIDSPLPEREEKENRTDRATKVENEGRKGEKSTSFVFAMEETELVARKEREKDEEGERRRQSSFQTFFRPSSSSAVAYRCLLCAVHTLSRRPSLALKPLSASRTLWHGESSAALAKEEEGLLFDDWSDEEEEGGEGEDEEEGAKGRRFETRTAAYRLLSPSVYLSLVASSSLPSPLDRLSSLRLEAVSKVFRRPSVAEFVWWCVSVFLGESTAPFLSLPCSTETRDAATQVYKGEGGRGSEGETDAQKEEEERRSARSLFARGIEGVPPLPYADLLDLHAELKRWQEKYPKELDWVFYALARPTEVLLEHTASAFFRSLRFALPSSSSPYSLSLRSRSLRPVDASFPLKERREDSLGRKLKEIARGRSGKLLLRLASRSFPVLMSSSRLIPSAVGRSECVVDEEAARELCDPFPSLRKARREEQRREREEKEGRSRKESTAEGKHLSSDSLPTLSEQIDRLYLCLRLECWEEVVDRLALCLLAKEDEGKGKGDEEEEEEEEVDSEGETVSVFSEENDKRSHGSSDGSFSRRSAAFFDKLLRDCGFSGLSGLKARVVAAALEKKGRREERKRRKREEKDEEREVADDKSRETITPFSLEIAETSRREESIKNHPAFFFDAERHTEGKTVSAVALSVNEGKRAEDERVGKYEGGELERGGVEENTKTEIEAVKGRLEEAKYEKGGGETFLESRKEREDKSEKERESNGDSVAAEARKAEAFERQTLQPSTNAVDGLPSRNTERKEETEGEETTEAVEDTLSLSTAFMLDESGKSFYLDSEITDEQ